MESAPSVPTVARLVLELGETVARVVEGGERLDSPVERAVIHDRDEEPGYGPGTVLLGVGVRGPEETRDLALRWGALGGVALLVREPAQADESVLTAVRESGIVLIEVSRAVSWTQIASLVHAQVDTPEPTAVHRERPAPAAGDLSELANTISALLDAPVTIEDRSCRVLAFSAGDQDADEGRRSTVLGQRVPERYRRSLAEQGVFRELYRSGRPVYVSSLPDDCLPRLAVAVRAGDEVLGFLWAVVRGERPDEPFLRSFVSCGDAVALELLRRRSSARATERVREDTAATMLQDTGRAQACAEALGLEDSPCCVVAISAGAAQRHDGAAGRVRLEAEVQRIAAAFGLHLSGLYPSAVATSIGGTVYGVVPSPGGDDTAAARVAAGFLHRMGERAGLRAGIGRVAASPGGLAGSRADAEAVLDVLADTDRAEPFATWHAVRVDLMVRSFAEAYGPDAQASGPVANLIAHDGLHGTDYARTLDAYLTAFGDVAKASAALHIHQNTFRYRLGRLSEIGELDLKDPDARITAILDLRALRLNPPVSPARRAAGVGAGAASATAVTGAAAATGAGTSVGTEKH